MSSRSEEPGGAVAGLRLSALRFVDRHRHPPELLGRYRYSTLCRAATLYSSAYAAMARSLLGDLETLDAGEREEWVAYIASHQDQDGLFRDPVIFGQGWYRDDPLWCGRPHLSCHAVAALSCLDAVAPKPIRFLEPYLDPDRLERWLAERDWGERVAWTGNEVMNVGTLLQYSRDFHDDARAGRAVEVLLDWLSANHLDPRTGVWGDLDVSDPVRRSHAVQAAYHWWPLYLYDERPIPHVERAVDTLLATQNPQGGFGWGVHNPARPWDSSACEDIDSVHPLACFSTLTPHRRDEVRGALERAALWILGNQCADGGFVFVKGRPFEYGHPELAGAAGRGAMFPTWFRLLSLAYIGTAVPGHALGGERWRFARCPGVQFRTRAGSEVER